MTPTAVKLKALLTEQAAPVQFTKACTHLGCSVRTLNATVAHYPELFKFWNKPGQQFGACHISLV